MIFVICECVNVCWEGVESGGGSGGGLGGEEERLEGG